MSDDLPDPVLVSSEAPCLQRRNFRTIANLADANVTQTEMAHLRITLQEALLIALHIILRHLALAEVCGEARRVAGHLFVQVVVTQRRRPALQESLNLGRSEERRVGKE